MLLLELKEMKNTANKSSRLYILCFDITFIKPIDTKRGRVGMMGVILIYILNTISLNIFTGTIKQVMKPVSCLITVANSILYYFVP